VWYTGGNQELELVMDATADLERQIIEAIPDWIEREPDLRRRLQNALSKTADSPPRFATPEYWLIDPIRQQAEFYQLGDKGRYQFTALDENGRYHSHILAGLWLQVDWLWLDPLPSIVDVLHQLELI